MLSPYYEMQSSYLLQYIPLLNAIFLSPSIYTKMPELSSISVDEDIIKEALLECKVRKQMKRFMIIVMK